MKRIFSFLIAITLVFALSACQSQKPAAQVDTARLAAVDDLNGTVTATSGGTVMPAFKGLALKKNDLINTEAESWSSLEFNEGQFVLVEENTLLEISELADNLKKAEITLTGGKIWVAISNKLTGEESFEVKTPACALSVRGTVFSVSYDKDGNGRIVVYEGVVNIKAGDKSYDVSEGAAEIIVENGSVKDVRLTDLEATDVDPFYIKGEAGPGGLFGVLRDRLERLTWDDGQGGFTTQGSASAATTGDSKEPEKKNQTQAPAQGQTQTQTQPPAQNQTPAQNQQQTQQKPQTPVGTQGPPVIKFTDKMYATPLGVQFLIPYTIEGDGADIKLSQAAQQAGFTVDTASGSGGSVKAPASLAAGKYTVTITATNKLGESSSTCTLEVVGAQSAPPVISVPANQSFNTKEGTVWRAEYTLTGTDPVTVTVDAKDQFGGSASNYFSIDAGARKVAAGETLKQGSYTVTVTAKNNFGNSSDTFTLTVEPKVQVLVAPKINAGFYESKIIQGSSYTAQFSATGSTPLSWLIEKSQTVPPDGAGIDSTGKLTIPGTAPAGYYLFSIVVQNGAGSDMITFEITIESKATQISPTPPLITTDPGLPINPGKPPIIP